MGLRCSLFGHAFSETATERDRETRGAEVVITVREVRTCTRCGTEQVIAENTEVRHVETGERATLEDRSDGEVERDQPDAEAGGSPTEPAGQPGSDTAEAPSRVEADPGMAEEESDPDISQFVERAEEPDRGDSRTGGSETTATESADATPPASEDEDVEILDSGDSEPAHPSSPGGPDEPSTEEGAGPVEGTPGGPTREREGVGSDTGTGESKTEESGEAEAGTEEVGDEDSAVEGSGGGDAGDDDPADDAVILDDDAGADEREADIGRRELAGTGNMFDTDAPTGYEGSSPSSGGYDAETVDAGDDTGLGGAEDSPAGSDDDESPAGSGSGGADHESWPHAGEESTGDADDAAFQFGPDMQTAGPDATRGDDTDQGPSGIKTGGPADGSNTGEDGPPRSVVCPECGYETRAMGASLRAGDICPECHGGYLTERR